MRKNGYYKNVVPSVGLGGEASHYPPTKQHATVSPNIYGGCAPSPTGAPVEREVAAMPQEDKQPSPPISNMPTPEHRGHKADKQKVKLCLVPPEWIMALGRLLSDGANKYGENNWARGMAWSKVYSALQRHALAFAQGEFYDKTDGQPHLVAIAWNALVLYSYALRGSGVNDLFFSNVSPEEEEAFYEKGKQHASAKFAKAKDSDIS